MIMCRVYKVNARVYLGFGHMSDKWLDRLSGLPRRLVFVENVALQRGKVSLNTQVCLMFD